MKIWQTYLLVAAVIIAPHLSFHAAIGSAAAWFSVAFYIASKGD